MKTKKRDSASRKSIPKKMKVRIGMAMKHGFFLEASWMLTVLIQKKLEKIIGNMELPVPLHHRSFPYLLRITKANCTAHGDHEQAAGLTPDLIDRIQKWRTRLNRVLHDIKESSVSRERMSRLANEGIILYQELLLAGKALKSRKPITSNSRV